MRRIAELFVVFAIFGSAHQSMGAEPLRVIVMDPLAAPLCCGCAERFGQRRYDHLATFLEKALGRPIKVTFAESIDTAFLQTGTDVDLIFGQDSVVRSDAARLKLKVRPIARLTDRSGKATLAGVVVVAKNSPASELKELRGKRVFLGPPENAEANDAGNKLFHGIEAKIEIGKNLEDGAYAVADGEAAAAVVPEFMPLLMEACGKVEPDSFQVLAKTTEVPFVTAFACDSIDQAEEKSIRRSLMDMATEPELLRGMESAVGFIDVADSQVWADWRGPNRSGTSPSVPARLPEKPGRFWTAQLTGPPVAGIAATEQFVVVPDKGADLKNDVFRCFDADTGKQLWQLSHPAPGRMEYTNAPRATPVLYEGRAYLLGALGDLHCVALKTGKILWQRNLLRDFKTELPNWGTCSPPLVVDDKLIVNPGSKDASLAALNLLDGNVIWQTPGHAAAYSAFILAELGGRRQIIGYDSASLGGWDPKTGKRLWEVVPPGQADFNVGTPVVVEDMLLVATENNGARLYRFGQDGKPNPKPIATNVDFGPDTCTPVVVNGRAFGNAYGELWCLDVKDGLRALWTEADDMFYDHSNLIAGDGRVLIWTTSADLLLIDASANRYQVISKLRPWKAKDVESMSHPALGGDRLYLRSGSELICLRLSDVP